MPARGMTYRMAKLAALTLALGTAACEVTNPGPVDDAYIALPALIAAVPTAHRG